MEELETVPQSIFKSMNCSCWFRETWGGGFAPWEGAVLIRGTQGARLESIVGKQKHGAVVIMVLGAAHLLAKIWPTHM